MKMPLQHEAPAVRPDEPFMDETPPHAESIGSDAGPSDDDHYDNAPCTD